MQNYQFIGIRFQDVSKIVQHRLIGRTFVEKSTILSYQTLKNGPISWSWKQYGKGKRLLLAFHGFNRSPEDFETFGRWLGEKYTILAFDLFFHGKSYAEMDEPHPVLTLPDLKHLLDEILDRYKFTEFEVIAYSFGGRLALNCIEIYGNRMKGLYLMAPDGLRFNPGFFFAVQTRLGRLILKKYTHDASHVIKIMRVLSALKLYNPKVMDFYINHLVVESMRLKVYHTWMFHRSTVPDLNRVIKVIQSEKIRLLLFFGKFDMIIPVKPGVRFAKKTGLPNSLHILETGHRVQEKSLEVSEIILKEN